MKKRKNQSSQESNSKKRKTNVELQKFKDDLQGVDPFSALRNFCELAENKDGEEDVIKGLLDEDGNCNRITDLLDTKERRSPDELATIFQALTFILLRLAEDLEEYAYVGKDVGKFLLQNHRISVVFLLSPAQKTACVKSVLRLLSAIVSQGDICALEVLNRLDLSSKNLDKLAVRTDIKDPMNIRVCLIHFILSFLFCGGTVAIRQLLQQKGSISRLFPGLKNDPVDVVTMILTTIKTEILENAAISKTLKVRAFGAQELKPLLVLGSQWTGPKRFKEKKANDEPEDFELDAEEKEKVVLVVHDFLSTICTSHKHGIAFMDRELGLQRNNNHVLFTLLREIKKPWNQDKLKDLVLSYLESCPDQMKFYLPTLAPLLEPRASKEWLSVHSFCIEAVKRQDPSRPFKTGDHKNEKDFLSMLCPTILPSSLTGKCLSDTFAHEEFSVRNSGLELLKCLFSQVDSLKNYCDQANTKNYTTSEKLKYFYATLEIMNKALPTAETVYKCWEKAVNDSSKHEALVPHLIVLMEVLCGYAEFLPRQMSDITAEVCSILGTLQTLEDDTSHLYLPTLKLISKLHNPSILLLEQNMERNVLYLTLKLLATTSDEKLMGAAKELVDHLLSSSGVICTPQLMQPWLHHMEGDMGRITFIVELMQSLLQKELEVEKNKEQNSQLSLQDIEEFMEEFKSLSVPKKPKPRARTYCVPVNTIVSTALQKNQCWEYLSQVLMDYVHMAEDLTDLGELLSRYERQLSGNLISFVTYLSSGNADNCFAVKKPKSDSGSLSEWLKYVFITKKTKHKAFMYENTKETWIQQDLFLAIKQICCYLRCLLRNSSSSDKDQLTEFYADFLQEIVVLRLEDGERTKKETEEFLRTVLDNPVLLEKHNSILVRCTMGIVSKIVDYYKAKDEVDSAKKLNLSRFIESCVQALKPRLKKSDYSLFQDYKKLVVVFETLNDPEVLKKNLKFFLDAPVTSFKHRSGFMTEAVITLLKAMVDLEKEHCQEDSGDVWEGVAAKAGDLQLLRKLRDGIVLPDHSGSSLPSSTHHQFIDTANHLLVWYCGIRSHAACTEALDEAVSSFFMLYPQVVLDGDQKKLIDSCLSFEPIQVELLRLTLESRTWQHGICDWMYSHSGEIHLKPRMKLMLMHLLRVDSSIVERLKDLLGTFASEGESLLLHPCDSDKWEKDALAVIYWKYASGHPKKIKKHVKALVKSYEEESNAVPCESRFHLMDHLFSELERVHKEGYEQWTGILLMILDSLLKQDVEDAVLPKVLGTCQHQIKVIEKLEEKVKKDVLNRILSLKSGSLWDELVRKCIKLVLDNDAPTEVSAELMKFLYNLCNLVLTDKSSSGLQAPGILQLLLSHNNLSNIMIEVEESSQVKEEVLRLWLVLVKLCPQECQQRHVPLLLAAYSASLSSVDQLILQLLHIYSSVAKVNIIKYQPFAWGVDALHHYVVKSGAISMYTSPQLILESIRVETMENTLQKFPMTFGMQPHQEVKPYNSSIYDYRFFLSLFVDLLREDSSYVPPKSSKFVECGGLALTIMALSSNCPDVRSTAYTILSRFYKRLQMIKTKERDLWLGILDTIRFGCDTPGSRIPPLLALFLCRSTLVLRQHAHPMYSTVAGILIHRPALDFRSLPEWYHLWNSQSVKWKIRKQWLLSLLKDGCRTSMDFKLVEHKGGVKLLLSSLPSSLCEDVAIREQILDVLDTWASIPLASWCLIKKHAIISWLISQVRTDNCLRLIKLATTLATSLKQKNSSTDQEFYLFLRTVLKVLDEEQLKGNANQVVDLLQAMKSGTHGNSNLFESGKDN